MATRHDIQDRLRSEITQLVAGKPDVGFSEIDSLSYLDNFIRETLRIYAPCMSPATLLVRWKKLAYAFVV